MSLFKDDLYRYSRFDSPIGRLFSVYSEKGVRLLNGRDAFLRFASNHVVKKDDLGAKKIIDELKEYFRGERKNFDVELDLRGSEFQLRVWAEISKIPYGEVRSYGQVARTLDMPKAYRAVGMACKVNPILILIPCHRVASSRGLGGYSLGVEAKRRLLMLEGAIA